MQEWGCCPTGIDASRLKVLGNRGPRSRGWPRWQRRAFPTWHRRRCPPGIRFATWRRLDRLARRQLAVFISEDMDLARVAAGQENPLAIVAEGQSVPDLAARGRTARPSSTPGRSRPGPCCCIPRRQPAAALPSGETIIFSGRSLAIPAIRLAKCRILHDRFKMIQRNHRSGRSDGPTVEQLRADCCGCHAGSGHVARNQSTATQPKMFREKWNGITHLLGLAYLA